MTLDQVKARYEDIKAEQIEDGVTKGLSAAFESLLARSKVDNIDKCICTSLGSFTSEKYEREDGQPSRPMYQLYAFEIMKGCLEKHLKKDKIEIVHFQDPEMNSLDIAFLNDLGYQVIEHPQALEEVAPRNVFVFTPGAVFEHVRDLFDAYWPSVYVGHNIVRWVACRR
ncbi:MAG: hypothetical protein Q9168_001404 [Polycauliona sp. 1 TL-2023]